MTGPPFPLCVYCKKPITATSEIIQRVQGWQVKSASASRRGGADIVKREALQEFCCRGCLECLRMGLSTGQEALL